MRPRITILCGFLLFTVMSVAPAQAGPWSAFISWLSDLDPKSGGIGVEFPIFCTPATPSPAGSQQAAGASSRFLCERPIDPRAPGEPRLVVKASAAFLLGTLNDNGGTMFAAPVLGIVEKQWQKVYVGAGAGLIHVGGTLGGSVTRGLVQVNVTYPIPKVQLGLRGELNIIPKGFPAGTFSPGSPATGTEAVLGISLVFLR